MRIWSTLTAVLLYIEVKNVLLFKYGSVMPCKIWKTREDLLKQEERGDSAEQVYPDVGALSH